MRKSLLLLLSLVMTFAFYSNANAAVGAYSITWEEPENGSISLTVFSSSNLPSGTVVNEDSQVFIEAVPASGYYTKSLTANGVDIMLNRSVVVTEDVVVEATFEKIPEGNYIIRYPFAYHTHVDVTCGDAAVASGSIVPANSSITVNVVPPTGVRITSVTANGTEIGNQKTLTVNTDINIAYQLDIDQNGVMVNYETYYDGGSITAWKYVDGKLTETLISGDSNNKVYVTQEVWVFAVPNAGYALEKIEINGEEQEIVDLSLVNPFTGKQTYKGARYPVRYEDINITATFKLDSGIADAEDTPANRYDYASRTLTAGEDVTVYNAAGTAVMKVAAGNEASLDGMDKGVYIVKGAKSYMKIMR